MGSLEDYAKDEKSKSNRVAWRERTSENEQLWTEAVDGIQKGYSVSSSKMANERKRLTFNNPYSSSST
jgi:hypothetical protein